MKYIIIEVELHGNKKQRVKVVQNLPIIFPNVITHRDVADAIIKRMGRGSKVVAAGDIASLAIDEDCCGGYSRSLCIGSRGKIDADIIRLFDYTLGVVEEEE